MAVDQRDSVTKRMSKPKKIYTLLQLEQFDRCMQKYKVNGIYDWATIYFKAGVRNSKGAVLVHNVEYGTNKLREVHIVKCYIPQLEFDNKVDQWTFWKQGKAYVDEKKSEYYEQTAEEVAAQKMFDEY